MFLHHAFPYYLIVINENIYCFLFLPAEEQIKQKTFFSHTSGSLGARVCARRLGHMTCCSIQFSCCHSSCDLLFCNVLLQFVVWIKFRLRGSACIGMVSSCVWGVINTTVPLKISVNQWPHSIRCKGGSLVFRNQCDKWIWTSIEEFTT